MNVNYGAEMRITRSNTRVKKRNSVFIYNYYREHCSLVIDGRIPAILSERAPAKCRKPSLTLRLRYEPDLGFESNLRGVIGQSRSAVHSELHQVVHTAANLTAGVELTRRPHPETALQQRPREHIYIIYRSSDALKVDWEYCAQPTGKPVKKSLLDFGSDSGEKRSATTARP